MVVEAERLVEGSSPSLFENVVVGDGVTAAKESVLKESVFADAVTVVATSFVAVSVGEDDVLVSLVVKVEEVEMSKFVVSELV